MVRAAMRRQDRTGLLTLGKGDIVYRQDERTRHWHEVLHGLVRTCRYYADGRRQVTGFHFRGDTLGLEGATHWCTAEVVSDSALLRSHPYTDELGLTPARPELVRALQKAEQRILLLGHRTASERVAAFLLLVAQHASARSAIALSMPRADIADYLGLTVEHVSRTIRDLARKGVIAFDGPHRFSVPSWPALERAAGCEDLTGSRRAGRGMESMGREQHLTLI